MNSAIAVLAFVVGCNKTSSRSVDTVSAARQPATIDSAGGTRSQSPDSNPKSAMAGMDHSKMSMPMDTGRAQVGTHAARAESSMSNMPGMSGMASGAVREKRSADMSGKDHSAMARGGSKTGVSAMKEGSAMADMPGMDHSRPPTAKPGQSSTSFVTPDHSSMPGMSHMPDMAPMQGTTRASAAETADAKLVAIAAQLVKDSVVQRLIATDSMLRREWADPAIRRMLGGKSP